MSKGQTGASSNKQAWVELALVEDAGPIVALRDAAARWQRSLGINQWAPGEVSTTLVATQIAAREWHVVRRHRKVLASIRVLSDDPDVWGEQPDAAIYVHGLIVSRDMKGHRLGRALLRWAEARAATAGRHFLRLDCIASNSRLRAYYEGLGFDQVGVRTFDNGWSPVVLLEKPVHQASIPMDGPLGPP